MKKIQGRLSAEDLWKEFIRRLEEVNDETVSEIEHQVRVQTFYAWRDGIQQAAGYTFNGDMHYAQARDPVKRAIWEHRPLCCGVILDWGIDKEVEELVVELDKAAKPDHQWTDKELERITKQHAKPMTLKNDRLDQGKGKG